METVLKIENLSKSFGKKKIIDNITIDINSGEVLGFLGPNGAGKTTTIKMVMGFLFPDAGKITICGYDLKKNQEKAMSFLGGIVENPEMYKEISGRKNLEMYAKLHNGVSKNRIDEVVALVGMENRINEKVKKYSLGMKQRIGLAQALLHKPKILILDEPTNGLDPAGIRELRDILKKLAYEDDVAVLVSSHMLTEMDLMCDKIAIIDRGRIIDIKMKSDLISNVQGKTAYRFIIKEKNAALAILKEKYGSLINKSGDNFVELTIEEGTVPEIILLLTEAKIAIFGASKIELSLEDAFINITGGGKTIG